MTKHRLSPKDPASKDDIREGKGKRHHQKIKPYVVLQYLLRYTDEEHTASAVDIVSYLEVHGIDAERRSVCDDIHEINRIAIMLEEDCHISEADEILKEEGDARKLVVYNPHKKGFYIAGRNFSEYQVLAECIYASKFVSKKQADYLVETVCGFLSQYQSAKIKKDIPVLDRVRTNNMSVIANYGITSDAISNSINGEPHTPEKIQFKYLKYEMGALDKQIERRRGDWYEVSPYQLLINDGNYYLMAVNAKGKLINYRLDRMRNVRRTGKPREGKETFEAVNLKTYQRRVFNMYGGNEELVLIRFINPLLDVMVERFGTGDGVLYRRVDDTHLTVRTYVEVSDQFFGWLLGFGKRVKLMEASGTAVKDFKAYLKKISEMYS